MPDEYEELDAFLEGLDDGPSELGTLEDLIVNVLIEDQSAKDFMRERWVARTIAGLREMRQSRGLTQAEVATGLGTKQPSVARLEASSDITLSRLWDYAYACGETPFELEFTDATRVRAALMANPQLELTRKNLLESIYPARYWWGGVTNTMSSPTTLQSQGASHGCLTANTLLGATLARSDVSDETVRAVVASVYTTRRETTLSETLTGSGNSFQVTDRERVV